MKDIQIKQTGAKQMLKAVCNNATLRLVQEVGIDIGIQYYTPSWHETAIAKNDFSLSQVFQTHRAIEARQTVGKVVLIP